MPATVKFDSPLDNLASKAFSLTFELFERNAALLAHKREIRESSVHAPHVQDTLHSASFDDKEDDGDH